MPWTADLVAWYADNARELPWRGPDVSPYAVLVSEVMLQQTPVARVVPAYLAWLERWPTPAALAADSPGEAVRMWGRLGYPRRALRLHAACQAVVDRYDGELPTTVEELLTLPGVGDYTARAVAVFALGQRQAVVDTNVRRVVARVVEGVADAPVRKADLALVEGLLLPEHDAPTASVKPRPSASATRSPAPTGPVTCTDAMLRLAVTSDARTYPEGTSPKLTIRVSNASRTPCRRDLGAAQVELQVYSGDDRIWSSHDCGDDDGASVQTIGAGSYLESVQTWSGTRSRPGCTGERPKARPGTYYVKLRVGTLRTSGAVFQIRDV